MSQRNSINIVKFVSTLIFVVIFAFIIVYADRFSKTDELVYVNPMFVQESAGDGGYFDLTPGIVNIDGNQGIITYVVQAGDSLNRIARNFGTTVSHLKKVNKIGDKDPIKPGQKLILSDDEGIIYSLTEKINVLVFANKYNLNLEDLMTSNYIQDESEILQQGQEVFLNISKEQAYDVGLLERPKPVYIPKKTVAYKPTVTKTTTYSNKVPSSAVSNATTSSSDESKILSKRVYNKPIKNQFYAGFCTWYVSIITPQIFPYVSETKQVSPFGGNANQWYENAKNAGFSVGKTPAVGSIVVYYNGGARYYSAGHVAKVIGYNSSDRTITVEEIVRSMKIHKRNFNKFLPDARYTGSFAEHLQYTTFSIMDSLNDKKDENPNTTELEILQQMMNGYKSKVKDDETETKFLNYLEGVIIEVYELYTKNKTETGNKNENGNTYIPAFMRKNKND